VTTIPFNRPHLTGREFMYISEAVAGGQLAGNGQFTQRCYAWLERELACPRALLTHSCTAALEMAALLLDLDGECVRAAGRSSGLR
jgi:dTDP-4-amino-4,6-dideoxygalactose transaminase